MQPALIDFLGYWQKAAESEFGFWIEVAPDDLRRFEKSLQEARKDKPEYQGMQVCFVGDQIWLVKDTVKEILNGTDGRADPQDQP